MMKSFFVLFSLVALSGLLWATESLRQDININRESTFKLGDFPGAETPAFEDAAWDAINVPQFEGAFQDAEVYVNGTRLAEHKFGIGAHWRPQCEPEDGDR